MSETQTPILLRPPQYIVNDKGERVSVVLDIGTFRRIMEDLEDAYDNRLIDETEGEPGMPLDQALREEDQRRGL